MKFDLFDPEGIWDALQESAWNDWVGPQRIFWDKIPEAASIMGLTWPIHFRVWDPFNDFFALYQCTSNRRVHSILLNCNIAGEILSPSIWHELTHAQQIEHSGLRPRDQFTQDVLAFGGYDPSPKNNPTEYEAYWNMRNHEVFFPLADNEGPSPTDSFFNMIYGTNPCR